MVSDISPPTCAANFLASNPGALLFCGRRVGNVRMIFGFETRFSYPTPAEQQCDGPWIHDRDDALENFRNVAAVITFINLN